MVARKRDLGLWMIELSVSMVILTIVVVTAFALLRAQSREVRTLYEERVAWETAEGQLELLEEAGWTGLREEDRVIEVTTAGFENLEDAKCSLIVSPAPGGLFQVIVKIAWTDSEGAPRTVQARTLAGRTP